MSELPNEALIRLLSHIRELCGRAARGAFTYTAFLTPREAKHARAMLTREGQGHRIRAWGGYREAERVCLLFFPDYIVDMMEKKDFSLCSTAELLTMIGEEDPVVALDIKGSGYRPLSHRNLLGSLLSLGVEREVLGDIAVDETSHRATVFCTRRMFPFFLSSVERIGGDVVRLSETKISPDFDGGRRYLSLRDTIASPRLDCIVAALCNLSREAAATAIRSGLVELDYECEERPDHLISPPAVLSVRGKGKFVLKEIGAPTKKGRLPLLAEKYL